ncbi:16311_t:CDS:2 [Gigaspora margarita]|uniref:16311_t:CDS:1 n=1 Tax=Gigaspora margarita TaxID=4874 RepID=A0ABN7WIB5_GIGMA|nr:16311_t:CDS:2 [Gigaspora margarita]
MSSNTYSTAFWVILLFNIIINHIEDIVSNTEKQNEDFDDNDEVLDEIEWYISERPFNKDIDVLAW